MSLQSCIDSLGIGPEDAEVFREFVELHGGNEQAGVEAFLEILESEEQEIRSALTAAGFSSEIVIEPGQILYQDPVDDLPVDPALEATPHPVSIDALTGLDSAFKFAMSQSFTNNRDFKLALDERTKAEAAKLGIELDNDSPETVAYLVRVATADALYALKDNANAVGWYDEKVSHALRIMSLIHPELATDENARFRFIWGLAVTSNGLKVDKNFEHAEDAYRRSKRTGRFPTDLEAGQAQDAINMGLGHYNRMKAEWGEDDLRKFMISHFTATEAANIAGIKVDGEAGAATVRGAAILGPKIGNGFFSNLYGYFDALTMDRWLMRTWGRWNGALVKLNHVQLAAKTADLLPVLTKIMASPAHRATIERIATERDKELKQRFKKDGTPIPIKPPNPQILPDLEVNEANLKTIADWFQRKILIKKVKRNKFNVESFGDISGNELRTFINRYSGYSDGQVEQPNNGEQRELIRRVFRHTLTALQEEHGHSNMTMADLQALVWYPEKLLYDQSKSSEDAQEGYDDEEAPDYANAADQLAAAKGVSKSKIRSATADGLRAIRSGSGAEAQRLTIPERQVLDKSARKRFLARRAIHRLRSNRDRNAASSAPYQRDGGRDGKSIRLLRKDVIAVHTLPKERKADFKLGGIATVDMYEVPAEIFAADFAATLSTFKSGKFGAAVYVYSEAEYQRMRIFRTKDGKAGFAIKDGRDIVSVYSGPEHAGLAHGMMELAIQQGGRTLDAFDTVLPDLYSMHGFKINARLKWSDEYAPPGWDKATFKEFNGGEPDVVYMALDVEYKARPQATDGVYATDPELADQINVAAINVPGEQLTLEQSAPASRVDMSYTDVTTPIPQLTEAALAFNEGKMTRQEYAGIVNKYKPVTPYKAVPQPTTDAAALAALRTKQKALWRAPRAIKEGEYTGVRLDIPAYRDHGVWVVSVHQATEGEGSSYSAGRPIGYDSVAIITGVTMGVASTREDVSTALAIAQRRKPKTTIATMKGSWSSTTPAAARRRAKEAMNDPAWVQVGMDPERHTFFYDRETQKPVISADEIIQVGPLVLAKNPSYDDPKHYLFQDETGPRGSFRQEGRVYGNINNIIALTDGADATTFLHEMAHFWAKWQQQVFDDPDLTDDGRRQLENMLQNTRSWMRRNAKSAWKDMQKFAKEARAAADANPGDSMALSRALQMEGAVKHARSQGGVKYMEKVADRFMAGDTTVWQQALEVAYHEQWARGMERWYFEGTAPTSALRGAFTKFSNWWSGIYPSLEALNVDIDPQIRGVYARLTASEEAINQEHADLEYVIPPEIRAAATPDEVEELKRLGEAARVEASAVIQERVARRLLSERRADRADRKDEITKEVTEAVRSEPLYRALNLISSGTMPDGEQIKDLKGNPVAYKISKEEFVARYGEEAAARVLGSVWATKKKPALANMDEVARLSGYDHADAMAAGLSSGAPSEKVAIKGRVEEALVNEFGATLTPAQLIDDAEGALINEDHIKMVALQARILTRLARPVLDKVAQRQAEQEGAPDLPATDREAVEDADLRLNDVDDPRDAIPGQLGAQSARAQQLANRGQRRAQRAARTTVRTLERSLDPEAIKEAAIAHIGTLPVHKVTPGKYRATADRLNVKIQRAVASRNYEEALGLMQKRMLNIQLSREAARVQDFVTRRVRRLKRTLNRADKKSKSLDNNMLNALRAALAPLGLAREIAGNLSPEAALSKMKDVDPAAYQDLVDISNNIAAQGVALIAEAERLGKDAYELMSVDQFTGMLNMASMFLANSRDANAILANGIRIEHDHIAGLISEKTQHRGKDETPALTKRGTKLQRWSRGVFGSVNAYTRRIELWAKMMDNGAHDGPLTQYFVRPVLEAVTAYKANRAEPLQALVAALQPVHGSLSQMVHIEANEIGHEFTSKGELIAALTHTGNQSNLRKLLLGGQKDFHTKKGGAWAEEIVDEETGEKFLDTTNWDNFLARAEATGIITKEDWDLVQSIWDILEQTKQGSQQAHFAMNGYYFKEVTSSPVQTSFGEYRGGYVPAIADSTMIEDGHRRMDMDTLSKQQNSAIFPGGEDGFTKSRTEVTNPMNLDLAMLPAHLDSVLKYTYIAPAVRQAALLLKNKNVTSAIGRVDSNILDQALIPWLQRTVNHQTTTPTGARTVDRFFMALNRNVGMNAMAANFVNAAQQVTGLATALSVIDSKYLMQAKHSLRNGDTTREFITTHSSYMQNRMVDSVRELTDNIDNILVDDTPFRRTQAFARKYAYFAQQLVQNQMDSIVWMGAWAQAKQEGGVWQQIYEANLQELGDTQAAAKADAGAAYYADSLVRDTQTPMEAQDISRIEAGTAFTRLFTKFYSYFNNQRNLVHTQADLALQEVGWQGKAGRMFHLYLVTIFIPAVMAEMFSMLARGELDEWDDEERLPTMVFDLFAGSQIAFVANFLPGMHGFYSRLRGEYTPEFYDDRLSFSPVIGSLENMVALGLTVGELVVDYEGVDGPRGLRTLLTSIAISTGIPLNWFIKPATWMMKVQEGDMPSDDVIDIVQGFVSGRSKDK